MEDFYRTPDPTSLNSQYKTESTLFSITLIGNNPRFSLPKETVFN